MGRRLATSIRHLLPQAVLLSLALVNAGCLAVAAGAAGGAAVGYAYFKGRVYENYDAGFNDTWAATETSLKELGMPILSQERKANTGYIETRTAEQETVRVYLEAVTGNVSAEPPLTRVSVRVATFGDKPLSNRVLDQVDRHLVPATARAQALASLPQNQGIVQTSAPVPAAAPQTPAPSVTGQTPPPPLSTPETPIRK